MKPVTGVLLDLHCDCWVSWDGCYATLDKIKIFNAKIGTDEKEQYTKWYEDGTFRQIAPKPNQNKHIVVRAVQEKHCSWRKGEKKGSSLWFFLFITQKTLQQSGRCIHTTLVIRKPLLINNTNSRYNASKWKWAKVLMWNSYFMKKYIIQKINTQKV